jgi:hypothetical protein
MKVRIKMVLTDLFFCFARRALITNVAIIKKISSRYSHNFRYGEI